MARERIQPVAKELLKRLRQGRWFLYEATQTPGALLQHHGIHTAMGGPRAGIVFGICPEGSKGLPVLTFEFREAYISSRLGSKPRIWRDKEILELGHMAEVILGPVNKCWNGAGHSSFSIGLRKRANPSLLAAVQTYHDGCPDHPSRSVFCSCPWFPRGYKKMRIPVGFI
jgi:hypothetical protein